ncbi:MAG TPA: biotin--[acetyl-CoA-carboxylase] ligase [Gaiellaceae bacterium]|nr:biotin--[acetyl-CoA-carboxylase] ligase [Gaiellaceae bacterium]
MADSLAPDAVRPLLRGRFGKVYRYAEVTPSTQRMLSEDSVEGAVAATEEQTEGRGRLGRRWEAAPGSSILVSVLLVPPVEPPRLPELSLVAGGAVAQAIAEITGIEPAIKFPNDLLIGMRKVAGILAESSDGRVVLGIGVNVNQTARELPADTLTPPTSLRVVLDAPVDRARLLASILLHLERDYDAWITGTATSG